MLKLLKNFSVPLAIFPPTDTYRWSLSMTSAIPHEVFFTMRVHNFWYSE